MKRLIIAILLVVLILPTIAIAGLPDVSGLSIKELIFLRHTIDLKISAKKHESDSDQNIIFSDNNIIVLFDSVYVEDGRIKIKCIFTNDTDSDLEFCVSACNINGWDIMSGSYDEKISVRARSKKIDAFSFLSGARLAQIEDASEIQCIDYRFDILKGWNQYYYKSKELKHIQITKED